MILWKVVVRDHNGKVLQVYERYNTQVAKLVNQLMQGFEIDATQAGNTITISALS